MCKECLQTPCHPRCPNAEEKVVCYCELCGNEIYEGETMYAIDDMKICEDCVYHSKTTAELDE